MKKIGIFYGSSSGNTASVAEKIGKALSVPANQIKDIARSSVEDLEPFDVLLLGTSTWGEGDLQDDWYDILSELKTKDLSGKVISFFGCGDSASFEDTFCGGMSVLYNDLQDTGATFVGKVSTDGYNCGDTPSIIDGEFIGLPLDEDNEDDETDSRIESWVESLQANIA